MNALQAKPRAVIAKDLASARTPAQLCQAASGNGVPAVFTHMASPYILNVWKDRRGKRNYFEASAKLLDSQNGKALLIYGSEREAEITRRIFATYGVLLEQFPFIISPTGIILPRIGKPIDSVQSTKGIALAKGMIASTKVLLAGGLMRADCVFDTLRDLQAIAMLMGRKAEDFTITTHYLITRDAHEIIPRKDNRDWENPKGL